MKISEIGNINFRMLREDWAGFLLLTLILTLILVLGLISVLLPNNLTQVDKVLSQSILKENVLVLQKEEEFSEAGDLKIKNENYNENNNQFLTKPIEQVLNDNKELGLKDYRQFKRISYATKVATSENPYRIELLYTLVPPLLIKDEIIKDLSIESDALNILVDGLNNPKIKTLADTKKELEKLVGYEQLVEYNTVKPFELKEASRNNYPAKIKVKIVGVGTSSELNKIALETPNIDNIIREKLPQQDLKNEFTVSSKNPFFLEFDTPQNKQLLMQKYKLSEYKSGNKFKQPRIEGEFIPGFSNETNKFLILTAASQSGFTYDQALQLVQDIDTNFISIIFVAPLIAIIILFILDFWAKRKVYARFLILNFKKTQVLQLIIFRYLTIILPAIILSVIISIAFLFFFDWRFNLYFNAFPGIVANPSSLNQVHPLNLDYWWLFQDLAVQFMTILFLSMLSTIGLLLINKKRYLN